MVFRVHGMSVSGNCHKVRQILELTHQPYEWIEIDSAHGGTRTPEFLALNPNGKVPVLEFDDGRVLPESNAILCYLSEGTPYLPEDRFAKAQAMQWLFFEQYSHEPYIAVARFIEMFLPEDHPRRAALPNLIERGMQALAVMDRHLASRDFFVGGAPTIADIALHAYTHCAADGGFDLDEFPNVRAWLKRLEAAGFGAMP
ncbi:MAG TPA: glutathione S-transferase family protein [Gammaproteobacteria bacterium]